jgi:alkaline phosphatase D
MVVLAQLLLLAVCAQAYFEGNINYNSPSRRHENFGISLPKVKKRLVQDVPKIVARGGGPQLNFTHSVASGDPLHDSVILWTRLAPVSNTTQLNSPVCLNYQVSTSKAMTGPVAKGTAYTSSDIDFTVKVEATGLQPFTVYYYQFESCDGSVKSPVGRTKTSPAPCDEVNEGIKFAVYSCSNYRILSCNVTDRSPRLFPGVRRPR